MKKKRRQPLTLVPQPLTPALRIPPPPDANFVLVCKATYALHSGEIARERATSWGVCDEYP